MKLEDFDDAVDAELLDAYQGLGFQVELFRSLKSCRDRVAHFEEASNF